MCDQPTPLPKKQTKQHRKLTHNGPKTNIPVAHFDLCSLRLKVCLSPSELEPEVDLLTLTLTCRGQSFTVVIRGQPGVSRWTVTFSGDR